MPSRFSLISAVGSPLDANERLDERAFEIHVADQFANGITGLLVAGTMGLMQMLSDEAYRQIVNVACRLERGKRELMIGAGDASYARTRDRIQLLNDKPIDGIVILSPYLIQFSPAELFSYFSSLADVARRPVYLYDLPIMTRTKLDLETVLRLAEHPNIHGIKCSGEYGWTRQLIDSAPSGFRVIVAQANLIDTLYRSGVYEHLDGIFSLAPAWSSEILSACQNGDWELASLHQQRMSELLRIVIRYGIFPTFTALLNARGIPGQFAPRPFAALSAAQLGSLMKEPIVRRLLEEHPTAPGTRPTDSGKRSPSVVGVPA